MRILFLTQYFPPETGAPQNRICDLAERLSHAGHAITILTAFPNYPRGEVFGGYRGRLVMEDQCHGLRVVRTWIYATARKGFLPRLVNYFSFVLSSVLIGAFRTGRQDVVVIESPPLFLGLSGLVIGTLKRARVVFNVSDLWPDSAVALGVISNRALIRFSHRLEQFIYRKSDLITGQTRGIVASVRARAGGKPTHLLTNGVAVESFRPQPSSKDDFGLRAKLGLEGKLVVGYAGLHGLAQGLETLIEAAQLLASHSEVAFLLVGDGVEKRRLRAKVDELGLKNIFFCDTKPKEKAPTLSPPRLASWSSQRV